MVTPPVGFAEHVFNQVASTTKHWSKNKFNREAASLWETSDRPQTEIVKELEIMPMMRRWRRKLQRGGVAAIPAVKSPVSIVASPVDQTSEIARCAASWTGRGRSAIS